MTGPAVDTPRYFHGIMVRNGYLTPPIGMTSETAYITVLDLARAGDTEAQEIAQRFAFSGTERMYIASKLGIAVTISYPPGGACHIHLHAAWYPKGFPRKCGEQLKLLADEGDWCAQRLIAYIAMKRFSHSEFELTDE